MIIWDGKRKRRITYIYDLRIQIIGEEGLSCMELGCGPSAFIDMGWRSLSVARTEGVILIYQLIFVAPTDPSMTNYRVRLVVTTLIVCEMD